MGAVTFVVGVVAVFVTNNSGGAAALLAIGAVFLALSVLGDRIEQVNVGGASFTIGSAARGLVQEAGIAELDGRTGDAAVLAKAAADLDRIGRLYAAVREAMPKGRERTDRLELLLGEVREIARVTPPMRPEWVREWFDRGTDDARVVSLALMEGDVRLADLGCAVIAASTSRTAFEQYHGLRVARGMIEAGRLTSNERSLLRDTLLGIRGRHRFEPASDRGGEIDRILAMLEAPEHPA